MAIVKKPNSNVYKKFAEVYDHMNADRHSLNMTDYCTAIFKKFDIHPETGLDLCCGTGTAIAVFSDWGIKMSGLDKSAEMLAVAARKLKGKRVQLYQKELPKFRLLKPSNSQQVEQYDLVTSFYDSLNYLRNITELKQAFRSVYEHMLPGGWFIFDMNTLAGLRDLWSGHVFADARDDLAWVWRNEFHPKTQSASCHATFFVRKGKVWERFDEDHLEHAFDNKKIRQALKDTGFQIKGFYDCHTFARASNKALRICVVARKPR